MNAFVKKEIQPLLPTFIVACALGLLAQIAKRVSPPEDFIRWSGGDWYGPALVSFGAGGSLLLLLVMALNSFGVEMTNGTFPLLLMQPVSRTKIWRTKVSVLGAALALAFGLWLLMELLFACYSPNSEFPYMIQHLTNPRTIEALVRMVFLPVVSTVILGLVIFSSGLWTVLLLRQVSAAFWFSVLIPSTIVVLLTLAIPSPDPQAATLLIQFGTIDGALLLYSVAGYFFARWLFMRAQDLQWSGGVIALPETRRKAWFKPALKVCRHRRPLAALFWKEIQLHQAQFVIAFVLLLAHLVTLAIRHFGHAKHNSTTIFILESFWMLWLLMPVLIGCEAVAEERKNGTLAAQLCQPVSKRWQFGVKILVALGLSLGLGYFMPLFLEGLGNWSLLSSAKLLRLAWPLLAGTVLASCIISLYASSWFRSTLQALPLAVLGILYPLFYFWLQKMNDYGDLNSYVAPPLLLLVLLALAYVNFKQLTVHWRTVIGNVVVLAIVSVVGIFVLIPAIYHRAWEKFTPFEARHGAARLTQSSTVKMTGTWDSLSVSIPDGRMWQGSLLLPGNLLELRLGDYKPRLFGYFYEGSNWVEVIDRRGGIKADGTLWTFSVKKAADGTPTGSYVRFGSETNWNGMMTRPFDVLLTKTDGTLWRWFDTDWGLPVHDHPDFTHSFLERVGTESNWRGVLTMGSQRFLQKNDGSVWRTFPYGTKGREVIEVDSHLTIERQPPYERADLRDLSIVVVNSDIYSLAVLNNGTLWILEQLKRKQTENSKHRSELVAMPANLQFGTETNWVGVAAWDQNLVLLKNDGTLWRTFMGGGDAYQLDSHSDWLAVASTEGGVISLAADGSLWFWPLLDADFLRNLYPRTDFRLLMEISRKPQRLGNIFDGAERP